MTRRRGGAARQAGAAGHQNGTFSDLFSSCSIFSPMFSGLRISLLINRCFPCCGADGKSRERNAKHSLGRTGGRARGGKPFSGKREEASEILNNVWNDEHSEKENEPTGSRRCVHRDTLDNQSMVLLSMYACKQRHYSDE